MEKKDFREKLLPDRAAAIRPKRKKRFETYTKNEADSTADGRIKGGRTGI